MPTGRSDLVIAMVLMHLDTKIPAMEPRIPRRSGLVYSLSKPYPTGPTVLPAMVVSAALVRLAMVEDSTLLSDSLDRVRKKIR